MSNTFIYALADPRDGQVRYIGKTKNGHLRPKEHLREGSRLAKSNAAKIAWVDELKSAGLVFEVRILSHCTPADADDAERFCIAFYRHHGASLLNRTDGGPGTAGLKHSAETRARMAAVKKGYTPRPRPGFKHTAETLAKIAAANRGRKVTPETRAKISAAHTGRKRPASFGKRMSEVHSGKKLTEDHKARIAASMKGKRCRAPRPVVDSTGKRYASCVDAARANNLHVSQVWLVAAGKQRSTAGGLTFRFEDGILGSLLAPKSLPSPFVRVNLLQRQR